MFCSAFLPQNYDLNKERNSNFSEEPALHIQNTESEEPKEETQKKFIKWIDFNASLGILQKTNKAHRDLIKLGINDIGTCELLAYIALKNGNSFNIKTDTTNLSKLIKELEKNDKSSIEKYYENKYYKYYVESYHAILDGIINKDTGEVIGFHPIAKGFWHNGYNDFGNSRTYGYKRRHLGHDLYGGVGTPIIAMEGGTITELGWNRFGGWRIGIRSDDTHRYYYYAHLRKDNPYPEHLKLGDRVNAGDIIGYLGVTGYSTKENTNMSSAKPHLHFGIQIIFDPSQEDGTGEIWIDVYNICRFLSKNKTTVKHNPETKTYERIVNL